MSQQLMHKQNMKLILDNMLIKNFQLMNTQYMVMVKEMIIHYQILSNYHG